MTIKFMLNSPSDAISPYASEEHITESPFDGTNNFISTRLRSRKYSEAVAADVSSSVAGVTDCQYLGSMERIAREVYQIQIIDNSYEVAFIFDTHTSQDIQLHVEITSSNLPASDFETRYDKPLEALKLALKNRLIRDWKGCTWLIDDQSEMLCADLYPRFFRIENQCRAFSNEVLIHHLGQNWLDHPGLEKFKNSVCSMESAFKQTVPAFANINSSLLSMTLDGEMDAASFLEIEAKHRDEVVASAECIYHNGEGYEKDDGSCDIRSGSDYDDHEIRDFMDIVTAYIEEELNPNIKRLSDLEYECERYGGYYPVADFACAECGKNGVSVRDDFLPIGKCCYCGYENEVYVCERCGTVYDDTGGDKHLCNGCLPQDE